MTSRLQNRRDIASAWTSANPTLAAGEMGLETDTSKFKMGDGVTAWNSLAYAYTAGAAGAQGTTGAQGIQGIQGITGTQGLTGIQGTDGFGAQGTTGTQGLNGIQGLIGLQGTQGIQGLLGTAYSASFNAQTTAYTLQASDANVWVTMSSGSSQTITVPPSVFATGQLVYVQRIGSGAVPIAQGAGVTITSNGATSSAPNVRAQYSSATILCTGSNTFTVVGDIS
jgi:3D (Asp-Asp-Asp) domain-containing protein